MTLVQVIVDAIADGAAGAAIKGVAGDAVKVGYDALKKKLGPRLWWSSIEEEPRNPATHEIIKDELAPLTDQLGADEEFIKLLTELLKAIDQIPPRTAAFTERNISNNKVHLDFIMRISPATGRWNVTKNDVRGNFKIIEESSAGEPFPKKA